jgi:hypothetical protein
MWEPIETAPAVGKKRLLFAVTDKRIVIGFRVAGTALVCVGGEARFLKATHWQPLPALPGALA